MPRASVSGQVNVRLGLADMERLEALARSNGISVAAMAKELVLKAMSGEPTPKVEAPPDVTRAILLRLDALESAMDARLAALEKRRG